MPESQSADFAPSVGRRASVSVGFQLSKTKESLRKASVSGDLHEMQAALAAAAALGKDPGLEMTEAMDLARESADLRSSIAEHGEEAEKWVQLHDSKIVDATIGRFWQLMQLESKALHEGSADPTDGNTMPSGGSGGGAEPLKPGVVTRAGYNEFHIRINKTINAGAFDTGKALNDAQADWVDDIARFAEDATIAAWLSTVQQLFQRNAAESVSTFGWTGLFKTFDQDGQLDFDEFAM